MTEPLPAATTGAVVLVRYRLGEVGRTRRGVHQVPVDERLAAAVWTALCGEELRGAGCEQVEPGVGMPCVGCLLAA